MTPDPPDMEDAPWWFFVLAGALTLLLMLGAWKAVELVLVKWP